MSGLVVPVTVLGTERVEVRSSRDTSVGVVTELAVWARGNKGGSDRSMIDSSHEHVGL